MKKTTDCDLLFNKIYQSTYPALVRYIFFKVENISDMEDIVQNVYVDYYLEVLRKGKSIENPEAYLIKMANHKCAAFFSKENRVITLDEEDEWTQNIPDETDTALDAIQHATLEEIWATVAVLPKLDQRILIARFRFELTFPEIAEEFNMEETKIKARFYRALEKVRKILDVKP